MEILEGVSKNLSMYFPPAPSLLLRFTNDTFDHDTSATIGESLAALPGRPVSVALFLVYRRGLQSQDTSVERKEG